MKNHLYQHLKDQLDLPRRDFIKAGSLAGSGLILGTPFLWIQDKQKNRNSKRIKTNISDALKITRTEYSLPGKFPGKVVEIHDEEAMTNDAPQPEVIKSMFRKGMTRLTGKDMPKSFKLFFNNNDVIGIKVNPVGAGLISTRLEVVDVIIDWLVENGIKKQNIVIWDRFDFMLEEAGFTAQRFPEVGIEALQTMDTASHEAGYKDNSGWLDENGNHISKNNFDMNVYYWADVEGPKGDLPYLNQQVFNGKYSFFGKLLTKKLTKIINVPVFKNTGNGISMATKNMGYGAICNTNRLHKPLFFDVNVEVLAFPVIRDKMVLNIADGLRAQYDGGPMPNAQFTWLYKRLFFATDPFALDRVCHRLMVEKRKSMQVKVNKHPRFTEYFNYAEKLGLGVGNPNNLDYIKI